jgi:hypothetical protein
MSHTVKKNCKHVESTPKISMYNMSDVVTNATL